MEGDRRAVDRVYVLAVTPTSLLHSLFHFRPGNLAIVNGVFYFLLPVL
jgi:hypothetical protein